MILSIIIPVYNAEKYIGNLLKNIYNQKLDKNNFEVVIINDGSKDNTELIVKKFQKNRSNLRLINQQNEGSSIARNNGIKACLGEYIFFMDSDDYIAENTLEVIYEVALKFRPEIVAFEAIRTSSLHDVECKKNLVDVERLKLISGQQYLESNPEHRFEIWWYIVRKEFLVNNRFTFKRGVFHQDVLFTLSLFIKARKVLKLPLDVYRYYQSEGSSIRNKRPSHLKKIIDDYIILFDDIDLFLKTTLQKKPLISQKIISNIKKRKQRDAFFAIIRMVRAKLSIKTINNYLKQLKKTDSYPVKYSVADNQNNKLLYWAIIFTLNNKFLLFPIIYLYRVVK